METEDVSFLLSHRVHQTNSHLVTFSSTDPLHKRERNTVSFFQNTFSRLEQVDLISCLGVIDSMKLICV